MTDRDDERLRAFFRDSHEQTDPPAPPFAALVRPGRGARPARVGTALARVFGLVVVAGALLLVMRGVATRPPGDVEAMRLASELSSWEAPTDFLLQTPGLEFFQSPPRFGAGTEDLPGDLSNPIEEALR